MIYSDKWTALLIAIILAACLPFGHPDIPDKADSKNIPDKALPTALPALHAVPPIESPTPEPTPELSACEYEVIDLKLDLETAKSLIKDYECICEYE